MRYAVVVEQRPPRYGESVPDLPGGNSLIRRHVVRLLEYAYRLRS